jgi:CheY-like chemotaxis protein
MTKPLLLLVDDSTEMGLIVASLGRRAGCDVLVCVDAETAWDSLSLRWPDLVLLDVNLPGASGPDWLRRVRAAPAFAGLPIALYTHWGLPSDVAAGLDAGADFVFDKDLAARPADWQRRLAEIRTLASIPQQKGNLPGAWPTANAPRRIEEGGSDKGLSAARAAGLNQALRHPSCQRLPPVVIRAVLRQALLQTFARSDLETWIASDGSGLEAGQLSPSLNPIVLLHLSVTLTELIRRLLGAEEASVLRDALTVAVPGLSEFLAGS